MIITAIPHRHHLPYSIIAAIRIMGKRQLENQPAELVVTLLISDLAAVPMQESGMPSWTEGSPTLVLVARSCSFSGPDVEGAVFLPADQRAAYGSYRQRQAGSAGLKRMRVTIGDLVESLVGTKCLDIEQIQYAIAETNGKISVLSPEYRQPSVAT